jgi:hypothetical protein
MKVTPTTQVLSSTVAHALELKYRVTENKFIFDCTNSRKRGEVGRSKNENVRKLRR